MIQGCVCAKPCCLSNLNTSSEIRLRTPCECVSFVYIYLCCTLCQQPTQPPTSPPSAHTMLLFISKHYCCSTHSLACACALSKRAFESAELLRNRIMHSISIPILPFSTSRHSWASVRSERISVVFCGSKRVSILIHGTIKNISVISISLSCSGRVI